MTDYILITSVTAEKLFGVFEESVRETCAKDYSAVQIDAWIARATPARWQQLLSGDLHFIAAVNQTSGEFITERLFVADARVPVRPLNSR